jgi:bifunctional non-homologous end joining protein LigD
VSLVEYRRKREFARTREPEPGKPPAPGTRAMFVVQLHHASRRHYDFRLQVGDVLKSWAVPKGPSYDPAVKRMAVEVEDHPLSYAGFEGEIPKGQYGGGHVARFDQGVWSTTGDAEAQLAKGHLRFELFGRKLKGGWHLVRSGKPARQPQWLLFKDKDDFAGKLEADDLLGDVAKAPAGDVRRAGGGKARKRKLDTVAAKPRRKRDWAARALKLEHARKRASRPGFFAPQLARLVDHAPNGEQWLHELKWDGYRILASVANGKASLFSRNALDWTAKLPDIAAAIESLKLDSAALDGELIAGSGAKADFNTLQATLAGERAGALSLVLFDLLHIDGVDVSAAPLSQRKELLAGLLRDPPPRLAYSSHVEGDGDAAYRLAVEREFEGIVSKRADRPHHAGRSDEWRKIKHLASEEFAVVGYTAAKGRRAGFGSLLLARPDPRHGWVYAGRVGSGFSDASLREIADTLGEGTNKPTVELPVSDPELRRARWFEPMMVVEVFFRGIGGNGLLRQPSLKAMRPDKSPADLRRDLREARGASKPKRGKKTEENDVADIEPTHPERIVFPEDGITKGQVYDYYKAMAKWLLPEIAGRPLSVVRCPQGIGRTCFFQKHLAAGMERVGKVRLEEESGEVADYLVVEDEAGLLELVQFNTLEFHPWGATARDPDRADRIVFDLDPGPDVAWREVAAAARRIRDLLKDAKLVSFLRTSGGKGLHVVVPLDPAVPWEQAKPFAQAFAEAVTATEPLKFVSTASKRLRKGRIFIDWLRNGRGATSVASFSLRARDGAPVAMPLRWEELSRLKGPAAFDIGNAAARMRRLKAHPWQGIDALKQGLPRANKPARKSRTRK